MTVSAAGEAYRALMNHILNLELGRERQRDLLAAAANARLVKEALKVSQEAQAPVTLDLLGLVSRPFGQFVALAARAARLA
jgi:hypothetical protein